MSSELHAEPRPGVGRVEPDQPWPRVARLTLAGVFGVIVGIMIGGCTVATHGEGADRTRITRLLSQWRADLPMTVPLPAVAASARQTLEARGYTVRVDDFTADKARLVAEPSDRLLARRIEVTVHATGTGPMLTVTPVPPSPSLAKSLVNESLARLGRAPGPVLINRSAPATAGEAAPPAQPAPSGAGGGLASGLPPSFNPELVVPAARR